MKLQSLRSDDDCALPERRTVKLAVGERGERADFSTAMERPALATTPQPASSVMILGTVLIAIAR